MKCIVYQNVKDYNPMKKRKALILFDDLIAGMKANKKLSPRVTEFFLRERKLNILLVFISQYYLKVSKSMRLNSRHYFIIEIPNKKELWQIVLNHSFDLEFKDCLWVWKDYTKKPFSFLVNDTTLMPDNTLRLKKELL